MIQFAIGMLVGGCVGFLTCALLSIAAEERAERKEVRNYDD